MIIKNLAKIERLCIILDKRVKILKNFVVFLQKNLTLSEI